MVARVLILVGMLAAWSARAENYVLLIHSGEPAHRALAEEMPAHVRIVDVTHWRDVPAEIRAINPAHYPAMIDLDSGAVVERPGNWLDANSKLDARKAEMAAERAKNTPVIARDTLEKLRADIERTDDWRVALNLVIDALSAANNGEKGEK